MTVILNSRKIRKLRVEEQNDGRQLWISCSKLFFYKKRRTYVQFCYTFDEGCGIMIEIRTIMTEGYSEFS